MSRPRAAFPYAALAMASLMAFGLLALPLPAQARKPTGAEVWAANCGRCHRLRAIDAYSASQWETIVAHMALNARLTPDETDAVRQFLVEGAKARQAPAAASLNAAPAPDEQRYLPYLGMGSPVAPVRREASACGGSAGEDTYKAYCAMCHGPKGKGDGPAAAGLTPRPANLSDPDRMMRLSDDSAVKVIAAGRNAMPAFGAVLTLEVIREVISHVRCLSDTRLSGTGRARGAEREPRLPPPR